MKSFKKIEPYIYIVTALLVDLFILAYGTLRHLLLPTTNRKGNLLSTLFRLFTELTERLIGFKQELTRTPWNYGKKYFRLCLLAVTWALFILSSFEWSGSVQTANRPGPTQETIQTTCPKTIAYSYAASPQRIGAVSYLSNFNISLPNTTNTASPPKRWLLLRRLLV